MMKRRVSVGAEVASGGAHFRVFAPKRSRVKVVLEAGGSIELVREEERDNDNNNDGYFSGFGDGVEAGALYRLRLDDDDRLLPDPASRFQPNGPHGPSEVIDPLRFPWSAHEREWHGVRLRGQVICEIHIGTFTREGTFASAMRELDSLADLGVTSVEVMPVAEFPGRFGWGYDGVDLYAPSHLYGRPDDFRRFVDRAHALGMGVLLDVVYNHLGPSGNYLGELTDHCFTRRVANDWGAAIDFETERGVRDYFIDNAGYWIDEFHLDGLRLDATDAIHDRSEVHVLSEIGARARKAAGSDRSILIFAENERQERPKDKSGGGDGGGGGGGGGCGYALDAMWSDDFHHSARALATGHAEACYAPTRGTAQELISAVKWGFLFQGQLHADREPPYAVRRSRGSPALDLPAEVFVTFLENHDQVANARTGARLHQLTHRGIHHALTTLLLLAPQTPMLFQGQEFAASAPFFFFADHDEPLAAGVAEGRRRFLERFSFAEADRGSRAERAQDDLFPVPHDIATFERCKLDHGERSVNRTTYDLFRDLLRLRREDVVFAAQDREGIHGCILDDRALALRFATGSGDDRLLLVNLGDRDLDAGVVADPLVAPPPGNPGKESQWRLLFATEDPRYGGTRSTSLRLGEPCRPQIPLLSRSAIVLAPSS